MAAARSHQAVALLGYALVYAAAVWLGRATRLPGSEVAVIWPAALVAVLWMLHHRTVAGRVTASAVLAVLTAVLNHATGADWTLSWCFAVVNLLLGHVTAACLRRDGEDPRLEEPRDLVRLLRAVVLGAVSSGVVAAVVFSVLRGAPFLAMAAQFSTRNGVTMALGLALVLRLRAPGHDWSSRPTRLLESAAWALLTGAAFLGIFVINQGLPLAYFVLPLSVLLALRYRTTTGVVGTLVFGAGVIVATLADRGVFVGGDPTLRAQLAQGLVGSVLLVVLTLALFRDSRERMLERWHTANEIAETAAESARQARDLFGGVLDAASEQSIIGTDAAGRITVFNVGAERMLGHDRSAMIGTSPAAFHLASEIEERAGELGIAPGFGVFVHGVSHGRSETRIWTYVRSDGTHVPVSLTVSAIAGPDGRPEGYIGVGIDVSARLAAEEELRRLALHDSLTGLANRSLAVQHLELALADRAETGRQVGVIYLDLDGFKQVNDGWGHAEGDELLVSVSERLSGCIRRGDTAARLGGDEFAVICASVSDAEEVRVAAERVQHTVRTPYALSSGLVHPTVSASVGFAVSEAGSTAESLLQQADHAMYAAKRDGKDRIRCSSSLDDDVEARSGRLMPELRRALDNHEFVMFGQPIVDLSTGEVDAVEMLVRWQHPTRGVLGPAEFLDVLEASPDVFAFGERVMTESLRIGATWPDTGGPAPAIHVNVSGRQLDDARLVTSLAAAMERHDVEPGRVVLELTETQTGLVGTSMLRDLEQLRARGVRIAVDDIGTGYSSLARLTELPIDSLKIDQRFVAGIGRDPRCEAIIRGVLAIAHALGLEVVGEGVETAEQAAALHAWGCGLGQGYHLGRPAPEGQIPVGQIPVGHAAV